jgi:hypothetical protein
VIDERVEARAIERHPHRSQHLARALGEGAQDCRRTVVGVPERRFDEAHELRSVGLQTGLCSHGRSPARRNRTPIPSMSRSRRPVSLESGVVFALGMPLMSRGYAGCTGAEAAGLSRSCSAS